MRMTVISPRNDVDVLAARYASAGCVSVPEFLPFELACAIAEELSASNLWVEIFRAGEKVYEMPHAEFLALSPDRKVSLRSLVEAAAQDGLQYRYRAIRVAEDPTERNRRGLALDHFANVLNTPGTMKLLQAITGSTHIAFADAQATDYRAGDFLTTHDDAIEGKNRLFAYVYSLTPRWQADWGGLLLLEDGECVSGFLPAFNVLRLFAVPRRHHVSLVAPWVDARRLSITGWLRSVAPTDHSGS